MPDIDGRTDSGESAASRIIVGVRNPSETPRFYVRWRLSVAHGSRLLGLRDDGVGMWDTHTACPPPERGGGR